VLKLRSGEHCCQHQQKTNTAALQNCDF
jgi:hypothetical protein